MSANTAVTLFKDNAQLPAHIAAAFEGKDNVLPRDTTPALTFRGKVWRLRQGGDEIVLTRLNADGEKEPSPVVQVVVVGVNQKRSRMFYPGAYEEGKNASPVCWSSDGEKPDKEVPAQCAPTCASCPNSVKGSKITANNKETTACSPVKRIAVVPTAKLDMEPLLLKIPQTSMWDKSNEQANAEGYFAWDQYVDFLRQRGVKHTAGVSTKIKFDSSVAYPKLLFSATRWLEADEVAKVVPVIEGEAVQKLLAGKINEDVAAHDEAAPAAAAPAAAPSPAPVTPPLAAKPPAAVVADDEGDGFAQVAATPAAAPAAPAKPPKATKPAAAPAPPPPPPPKPAVVAAGPVANEELAKLAAAWDD